ncbi:hypothetical protein EBZ38_14650 [bacterium]|nr:hypothetical protein [bacterium]NDD85498.1 hypothetical protein [bacterium]
MTATISVVAFRADWVSHMPIAALCVRYTISKDQVIRLRDLWNLPLRNDRSLRFKPSRGEMRDPTPAEIQERCKEIQARWDDRTRSERAVTKPQAFSIKRIEMTDEAREAVDNFGDE